MDIEFADACRAGDFVRYCQDPFGAQHSKKLSGTRNVIGNTGIAVAAVILEKSTFNQGKFTAAIKALDRINGGNIGATPADLMQLALKLDFSISDPIKVSKLLVDRLELDASRPGMENITFVDCYFNTLEIALSVASGSCPLFKGCLIQELDGRISQKDLPAGRFEDTYVEAFLSSAGTTSATLDLDIPIGAKVLVTILKKLFVQSMSGRKENALYRGLDSAHQAKVSPVLALLKSHSLVLKSDRPGDPIWIPVRRLRSRVLSIIASPSISTDPVIVAARKL